MKIAYIATGAAGMLCGTCIHDNALAAALQELGHEVALVPTYTPIRTDEESVSLHRVFLGGLNVYLQEKIGLFRHTPEFIDNLFNSTALLNWISKFSASTNARDLGALTVSVLRGEAGKQKKEVHKLIKWLKEEYEPDIVHLNHTLLLGFAREIKRQLGVPIICGAQGEDLFLDNLIEPYQSQAKSLLRERIQDVDGLITTSDAYSDFMSAYLELERERIHKVHLGIKLEGHGVGTLKFKQGRTLIGYFARICPEKGFHLLVEAFHQLWQKYGSERIQLKAAGYLGKKDEPFFRDLEAKTRAWGMAEAVEYIGEVDRLEKIAFLSSIDIFSVPTVYAEPKGLSILEALANGVPVVQPGHGTFPEVIARTRGGLLFEPQSAAALAETLEVLLNDVRLREKLGAAGKSVVHRDFGDRNMAAATLRVYEMYLGKDGADHESFIHRKGAKNAKGAAL
ncbi:MAG: glycosyltransferase family 4 protein [bacterium]